MESFWIIKKVFSEKLDPKPYMYVTIMGADVYQYGPSENTDFKVFSLCLGPTSRIK